MTHVDRTEGTGRKMWDVCAEEHFRGKEEQVHDYSSRCLRKIELSGLADGMDVECEGDGSMELPLTDIGDIMARMMVVESRVLFLF